MKQLLLSALTTMAISTMSLTVSASTSLDLINAVKGGDEEVIKAMLKSKVDVNSKKADGTTALHYAVHRNDLDTLKQLVKKGADPDAENVYGVTPIALACTNRNSAAVKILLDAGADANAEKWSGETILMDCVRTGTTDAVAALLKAGANPNVTENKMGQTPLMWAAAGGYSEITRLLLEHGAEVTPKTLPYEDRVPNTCRICEWKPSPGGFTALMFAARAGDVETARLLLNAGADINEATPEYGNPLVIAAASGHEDLAIFFLKNGADHESKDENGVTALHHAHQNGLSYMHGITYDPSYRIRPENQPKLVKALLDAGADPNAQIEKSYLIGPAIRSSCESVSNMVGATPYFLAAVSADAELLTMLSEYEADPSITTKNGNTPLMVAARSSCTGMNEEDNTSPAKRARALEAVKAIVAMGVDVNAVNEDGETAMHKAAFTGATNVVQYLADNGAEVDVRNNNGETPWSMSLGIAASFNNVGSYGVHKDTAELLMELGATVISRDEMNTPDAYSNFFGRDISIDYGDVTAQPQ
jgi:ankyrin repeat protein